MHLKFAAAACLAVCATAALAHQGATGVVRERMDVMKDTAQQMKSIAGIVRGGGTDTGAVALSAGTIAAHADRMPALFPEGSLHGPSEALPEIWENWEEFASIADDLSTRAARLAELARGGSVAGELRAAFAGMGETCRSCHSDFRVKKQ